MSTLGFSSSAQESVIGFNFEATLVNMLLLGVYTVVYIGTVYLYLTKKSIRNWIIVAAITALYLVYVSQTAISCFIAKQAFVNNGQTQKTIFAAIFVSPLWGTFVDDICYYLMAQISDGLLIWRCFIIWNCSFRVISLSLFLLFCEIAVNWTVIVMAAVDHLKPPPSHAKSLDTLTGTVNFLTLTTTLVTTVLISYRIHSVVNKELSWGAKAQFNHILDILIQSAVLYAFAALTNAVGSVISFPATNSVPLIGTQYFTSIFFAFTTGFAPTVMVAQVAYSSGQETDNIAITHISGLQFKSQSTALNISHLRTNTIHIEDREIPVTEELKERSAKELLEA